MNPITIHVESMPMFHNKSTKRLRRMLEAIRSRDFTLRFATEKLRGEERLLAEEINSVISEFREKQMKQEAMYGQFETMLNHVDTMLLVDDCQGNVIWMNQKAVLGLCGFRIPQLSMLKAIHPTLPPTLDELQAGQQRLLHLRIDDHDVDWNISMTKYFRMGEPARLFSINNIQSVILQKEVESQLQLVGVLTHEIMNSLSPIISLSDSLANQWRDMEEAERELALSTIHRRSEGLLTFVNNYRSFSRITPPNRQAIKVGRLIGDIQRLMPASHVTYIIEDANEEIFVDHSQMEHVLINLLKNAMEAVTDLTDREPHIELRTHADRPNNRFLIIVTDNGPGILPKVLDRIFIPFFTTKPNGSGIGLALCRQIIALHGGIIRVKSDPGMTAFTVEL